MTVGAKARALVGYIQSHSDFVFVDYADGNYDHIGATISDAILQAGPKYDTVVRPRIDRIRRVYPGATTTSAFSLLLLREGAKRVLDWRDEEKPKRVVGLTNFLLGQNIETEAELGSWLEAAHHRALLLNVRGIGPKSLDYIRILVGTQTAAVDRHVYALLAEAGIEISSYDEARDVLNTAADLLGMKKAYFDHSVWRYMSSRKLSHHARRRCKRHRMDLPQPIRGGA